MHGRDCRCIRRNERARSRAEFLEKEESLLARLGRFVLEFRHVRQVFALEGRLRILQEKGTGLVLSKLARDYIKGGLQPQWARSHIVRVAGDKMNEALADPMQRHFLGDRAKSSRKRAASNLHEAALSHPFFQALRVSAQDSVALRMRDDRMHPGELNFVERLIHRGRDGYLVELHEQIAALIDAIDGGIPA